MKLFTLSDKAQLLVSEYNMYFVLNVCFSHQPVALLLEIVSKTNAFKSIKAQLAKEDLKSCNFS